MASFFALLRSSPVCALTPEELVSRAVGAASVGISATKPHGTGGLSTEVLRLRQHLQADSNCLAPMDGASGSIPDSDIPAALRGLTANYEALLRGAAAPALLEGLRAAEQALQDELPGSSVGSRVREFCTRQLFCRPEGVPAVVLAGEQECLPPPVLAERMLRLLDLQVQLRLAVAALSGSSDPLAGGIFKEVKKFLQARVCGGNSPASPWLHLPAAAVAIGTHEQCAAHPCMLDVHSSTRCSFKRASPTVGRFGRSASTLMRDRRARGAPAARWRLMSPARCLAGSPARRMEKQRAKSHPRRVASQSTATSGGCCSHSSALLCPRPCSDLSRNSVHPSATPARHRRVMCTGGTLAAEGAARHRITRSAPTAAAVPGQTRIRAR